MDTETTVAQNAVLEQKVSRKSGRRSTIVMTSTTKLIRLQSDLKDQAKGKYEFRNRSNATRIITREMVEYSAMIGEYSRAAQQWQYYFYCLHPAA
jgi:hypothetical protein